jgi:type IV pilus assembly protein PilQ
MSRGLGIAICALVLTSGGTAQADRDFCTRGTKFRGAALDLDVKQADVHDVFRLLSDVGRVDIVVSDAVKARATLRLKRVPWDQIACTLAAMHRLEIRAHDRVLVVLPQPR